MRVKRKLKKRAPALGAALCLILAAGCMRDGNVAGEKLSKVKIVDVAPNDLGQVMVFAEDRDGRRMVFVKNFYESGKDSPRMKAEMTAYMSGLEKYRGKKASIRHRKDKIGDLIIKEIK